MRGLGRWVRSGTVPRRRRLVTLCMASVALLAFPAAASAAPISGSAFEDFNDNGVRNTAPMVDSGVGGITVTAYHGDGRRLTSTTTAADGSYTLDVPDGVGEVRVEFTDLPPGYQPARRGPASGTTVQYVTGPASGVDVGVLQPANYCQDNPQLALACAQYGARDGEHATDPSIRLISDSTPEDTTPNPAGQGIPGEVIGATWAQTGTVFGVAQPTASNYLYSAAYTKRHADYGPGGPGAIYRTDIAQANAGTPNASVFFDVNSLAGDPAGAVARPGAGDWLVDANAWNAVGNTGLGNLSTSLDGSEMYTVGLATRELIRIPIPADGSSPSPGSVETYPIPSPCTPAGDARPMGTGWHNGLLYVGGVCSMASVGDPAPQTADDRLRVYVYAFDPATGAFSPAPALDTPLENERLCTTRDAFNPFPSLTCSNQVGDPTSGDWHPWTSDDIEIASYPQPILADIEFVGDDMVLGIRDRWADQVGSGTLFPDGTGGEGGVQSGYNLRACLTGGAYQLESNGTCGGLTASGPKNVAEFGPGGSLFYWDQDYNHHPSAPQGAHDYTGLGGMVQIPGYPELRMSAQDVADDCPPGMTTNACPVAEGPNSSAGVLYLSNTDGSRVKGWNVYTAPPGQPTATFGKSNGLGDLEALCEAAPIEIGNYVWLDPDRDGIQDAGERRLADVRVELLDASGRVVATTTTNANGQYYFNESNVPGAVQPNTAYTVRIPLDQPVLASYLPTGPNTSAQLRDSDGLTAGRYVVDRLTTGAAGHNDHTHDFGFHQRTHDLRMTKTSSAQRVRVGSRFTYTLTAENLGPDPALPGSVIRDAVPEELRVLEVTPAAGATCDVDGQEVRCELGAMAVGQQIEVQLRVRAMEAGGTVNTAYVDPPPPPPGSPPCCDPPENNEDGTPVRVVKPKLGLVKGASKRVVQAGERVRFTIRVRNPSRATLRRVRTCDNLPRGLVFVKARPKARVRNGRQCWTAKRLRPGQRKTYRLTARALQGIRPGRKVNRARATSPDARPARDRRAVRVRAGRVRAGGVTG